MIKELNYGNTKDYPLPGRQDTIEAELKLMKDREARIKKEFEEQLLEEGVWYRCLTNTGETMVQCTGFLHPNNKNYPMVLLVGNSEPILMSASTFREIYKIQEVITHK